jgi:hypothetical protein
MLYLSNTLLQYLFTFISLSLCFAPSVLLLVVSPMRGGLSYSHFLVEAVRCSGVCVES